MIDEIETQVMTESFARLRKTARSDDDIEKWMKEYANFLPNVPEILVPYLEIEIDYYDSYTALTDKNVIARIIKVHYNAQLPQDKGVTLNDNDFEKMLNTEVRLDHAEKHRFAVDRTLKLVLPAQDWPYAMAIAGLNYLVEGGPDNAYRERHTKTWEEVFPDKPWAFVETIFKSGVLPEDEQAFIDWACQPTVKVAPNTNLPSELTP